MMGPFFERLKQGRHTIGFPEEPPRLPAHFQGAPVLDPARCSAGSGCHACVDACPTQAITAGTCGAPTETRSTALALDLGRCLFCAACADACPTGAVSFSRDYKMAASKRDDLVARGQELELAGRLRDELWRVFRRSLKLRQVSAGGCNGCEVEVNVLNTIVFDLQRFGIQFVASPRHADGLLVTGPVTRGMELALRKTYEAVPEPRVVIAVGACAISGGPYAGHVEALGGAASVLPVDLLIPGCPPHPLTILDGLLRLIGRISARAGA